MKRLLLSCTALTAVSVTALPMGAVHAQQQSDRVVEEVVVTATRREESLQEVPISVTALGEEALLRSGINDVTRLDAVTPGLSFGQSGSDARPAIRGARTESVNERQDPVIGYFIDGVYQSRTSQALAAFYDTQRVEVLRGPQGTLFGRNTFGGAINMVTNKPDLADLDYRISAEAGEFGLTRFDGFLNVPVSETFGFRLAGLYEDSDGYIENLEGEDWGQRDQTAARASFKFQPSDTFDALFQVSTWQQDGLGGGDFGYTVLGTVRDPVTGQTDLNGVPDPVNPRNGSGGEPPDPDPFTILRDTPATRDTDATTATLDLTWDVGTVTLRSITGYNDFETFRLNDSDFSPAPGSFSSVETFSETLTQEFQVLSNSSGNFDWIAGLYFIEDETTEVFLFDTLCTAEDTDGDPTTPTVCTGPGTPEIAFGARGVVDLSGYAAFGQGTFNFSDDFSVTVGLRYTEDDKDFQRFDEDEFLNNGNIVQILDESASFDEVTYRVGADWYVTETSMLYAHVSNGFNSGGFNTAGAELSFDEQTVTAYEIGSKNTLADGDLTLNAALYFNDFEDLLAQGFITTGPTVSVFSTNAGEAQILGLEIEAEWYATDAFTLTGAFSFTDSEVGDFIVGNPFVLGGETINGVPNLLNLDGSPIALTPDVTATVTGRYEFELGDLGYLTPFVQVAYSGEYLTNDVDYPGGTQDAYTLVDARLSWMSLNGKFQAEAYVNNITDEEVLNRTVVGGQDAIFANYALPRHWGVRLTYRYK